MLAKAHLRYRFFSQSDAMRLKRFQLAEKKAMQAPVKMLMPLVGFIFPTVFIILFGPMVLKIFL